MGGDDVDINIDIDMVVHDLEQCGVRRCCSGCSHDTTHADGRCVHELMTAAKIAIEALLQMVDQTGQETGHSDK